MYAAAKVRTVGRTTPRWWAALLLAGALGVAPPSRAERLDACTGTRHGYPPRVGELADGRALLDIDGVLALLSADRRELRPADWPASAGEPDGIVRLPGRGLLVGASHGLLLLDNAGRWQNVRSCEDMGRVDAVFHNVKGQVLLTTERGVFELMPDSSLRRVTTVKMEGLLAMPDDRWLVEANGALYGLNISGTLVPLLTGVKAAHVAGDRRAGWNLRERASSDWIRVGRGWLAVLSPGDAPVVVGDDGRVDWLRAPSGRPLTEQYQLIHLQDGRLFVLLESGLHSLQGDGGWRRVSAEVRWTTGCRGEHIPIGHSRELVKVGRQVFIITADDKAILLRTGEGCSAANGAAAIGDGGAWVAADGLFRLGRDNRLVPVPLPEGSGAPTSVSLVGRTHVIVQTEARQFRVDSLGRPLALEYGQNVADGDDHLYVCTAKPERLQRWVDGSRLEPVAAAAGRPCSVIDKVRDGSVVVRFGDGGPALRLDREGAAMPLPSKHIQLSDGDLYFDRGERATFVHATGRTSEIDLPPGLAGRSSLRAPTLALERGVHFVDSLHGFGVVLIADISAMHESGLLTSTDDGGRTWRTVRIDGRTIGPLTALAFAANGRHGMAVGGAGSVRAGSVWATEDGGITWQRRHDLGKEDLAAVWLPGAPGEAFVLPALAEDLYHSRDSGLTWVRVPRPLSSEMQVSGQHNGVGDGRWILPSFSDQGRRVLWTADEGDVMTSADEGRTWSLQWRYRRVASGLMAGNRNHPGVALFGDVDGRACVASDAGLFCSDPGMAVMRQRSDVDMAFTDLALAGDGRHGWAVGADGVILATADGGANWTSQSSGTERLLRGVFFLRDALHGWAWGDEVMLTTRDGGQKWERLLPRMVD